MAEPFIELVGAQLATVFLMDQARYKSKKSSSPWVEPVFLQMSASYFLFGMGMGS